jgi:hypothetical protein
LDAGNITKRTLSVVATIWIVVTALLLPFSAVSQTAVKRQHHASLSERPDSIATSVIADSIQNQISSGANASLDGRKISSANQQTSSGNGPVAKTGAAGKEKAEDELDSAAGVLTAGEAYEADSIRHAERNELIIKKLSDIPEEEWVPMEVEFNPDPTRAVWLSALFPGLGQLYNRRYWKLPIVVGGYLGLGYATSWNNQMLKDYTRAYSDLLDNDPSSNSYMDFFAPNVKESDIDKSWLQSLMKSRKNYFRRNRDLCIISMVGVYFLAMVDAYVDASLSHFDISPNLSMDVVPALMQDGRQQYPSIGLAWALNF